jgi:hypothetical protein
MSEPTRTGSQQLHETIEPIHVLVTDWFSLVGSRVGLSTRLVMAEARLAVMSFLLMLFLAVVTAVFVLGAWGVLIAGITLGLSHIGVPVWASLVGFSVAHAIAAALLVAKIITLSERLEFKRSRQQFAGLVDQERAGT